MENNTKLSIIMPLYNVADTLQTALDSILMQVVDFNYEIIAVDDASTDLTDEILKQNAEKYPQIKIIKHEKNSGNAVSFYDGLCASSGDYFCVLDGDDYYTVKYKLQKQVDFLDSDKENLYVGVSHKYLKADFNNDIFETYAFNKNVEFNYYTFLNEMPYYHTTTYMYRNIFRNKVPEFFKEKYCRGDNPRTFFHLLFTKGKIKVLDFVGSVYKYSNNGIWSKTTPNEQNERNINMCKWLSNYLTTQKEKFLFLNAAQRLFSMQNSIVVQPNSKEFYLEKLYKISNKYTFEDTDFVFKSIYKSTFIDSFCETIGYIEKISRGISLSNPLKSNPNNILIAVSNLTATGGGVYYEIKDIIEMYSDKNVYLLLTDLDCEEELNKEVLNELSSYKNLNLVYGKRSSENKVKKLFDIIINIAPEKTYYYCGHNNVFLNTLIQSDISKNICVFSFDHGFSLGLDNSNYDVYIPKRPSDYEMLKKVYGKKVIYIPCWNKDKKIENTEYVPFKNHDYLITASAAARFYKLQGTKEENYVNFVLTLLNKTRGKHVHIGPIDDETLQNIYKQMENLNIDTDKFIHIPWAKNLLQTLYDNCVDIFIEPFPTVSFKITLEVLSGGVPIISKNSYLRMQCADFFYPGNLTWNNKSDFINILSGLSKEVLNTHSELSRKYFTEMHDIKLLKPYFVEEKEFKTPQPTQCSDNIIINIDLVKEFFNTHTLKLTSKEKLFSIKNIWSQNKCHKIIHVLGIKIKLRNIKKEISSTTGY